MSTARFALSDSVDNRVIDAVLAALEVHAHDGRAQLLDPAGSPSAVLSTLGGALAGGQSLHYRYALLDALGFETAAGPEIVVVTPAPVSPPAAPVLTSTNGGLLGQGLYLYQLSVLVGEEETGLSPISTISLGPGEGTVEVDKPTEQPEGMTGWRIWRQGPAESGPTRVGVLSVLQDGPLLDDGSVPPDDCPCDPDNLPPTENRTNATNQVTVELSAADQARLADPSQPAVRGWRLYRSGDSVFGARSLLHEVVETSGTPAALVTSWVDDGRAVLSEGAPLATSRTLRSTPAITGGGGGGGTSGGHVQDPVLRDANGVSWALSADLTGELFTVQDSAAGTVYNRGHGPVLTDSGGGTWLLDVSTEGSLVVTSIASPATDDVVLAADAGPRMFASRGIAWRLGVEPDGALTASKLTLLGGPMSAPVVLGSGSFTDPKFGSSTAFVDLAYPHEGGDSAVGLGATTAGGGGGGGLGSLGGGEQADFSAFTERLQGYTSYSISMFGVSSGDTVTVFAFGERPAGELANQGPSVQVTIQ